MDKSNIVLIGMPGSGKSTCGVLAAKALLKNFFDTDLLLQGMEGNRLQDIIDGKGIEYFLDAEERTILSLDINATVIATGGLASLVTPLCKRDIILDEDLMLKGLVNIYNRNYGK